MFSTRILLQVFITFYYIKESSPKFWNALASLDPLKDQPLLLKDNTRVNPSLDKEVLQAQAEDRKFKIIKVLRKINKINRINPNFFKQKKKALKYISRKIPKYIKQFSKLTRKRPQRFFDGKKKRFPKKRQKCVPLNLFKQFSDDYEDYEDYEDEYEDDERPVNNQHYNYYYPPPPYVAAYPMPIYHPHRRSHKDIQENYNRRTSSLNKNQSLPQTVVKLSRQHIKIIPLGFHNEGQTVHYERFSNKDRIVPVVEASTENVAKKELGRNVLHANYSAGKGMNTNKGKLNV